LIPERLNHPVIILINELVITSVHSGVTVPVAVIDVVGIVIKSVVAVTITIGGIKNPMGVEVVWVGATDVGVPIIGVSVAVGVRIRVIVGRVVVVAIRNSRIPIRPVIMASPIINLHWTGSWVNDNGASFMARNRSWVNDNRPSFMARNRSWVNDNWTSFMARNRSWINDNRASFMARNRSWVNDNWTSFMARSMSRINNNWPSFMPR
jgi:hypothetical protein